MHAAECPGEGGHRTATRVARDLVAHPGGHAVADHGKPTPGRVTQQVGQLGVAQAVRIGRPQQLPQALAFRPDLAVVLAGGNDMLRRRFEPDAAAEPEMYSADQLHLSARGHAVVAAETVRALREVVVAGRIA
jgi:lysophospholipase L1-like esterase